MAVSIPVRRTHPRSQAAAIVATDIRQRLDRLRWGRFQHVGRVALGITWILDGLEVTLAGAISPALKESPQLPFLQCRRRFASSAYLAAQCRRAGFFGWLTDRLGRKRLFFITLAVYLVATAATALSWNLASFALFRFFTGAGIGGEYTAINSSIQELVPARYPRLDRSRHQRSFWIGHGARRGRLARAARSQPAGAGSGMALGLSHRRGAGPHHLPHAPVAAGIAALADDARTRRGGKRGDGPRSKPRSAPAVTASRRSRCRRSGCACVIPRRWRKSPTRCFGSSAGVPWWA